MSRVMSLLSSLHQTILSEKKAICQCMIMRMKLDTLAEHQPVVLRELKECPALELSSFWMAVGQILL
jgi:hypothetical protein